MTLASTMFQRAGGQGLAVMRIPECRKQLRSLRCWAGYNVGSFQKRFIATEKSEAEGSMAGEVTESAQKEEFFRNAVMLTGISGGVSLKEFASGKVKATLRLGVMKNATDRSWFDVTAWGPLAKSIQQNTKEGEGLCVTGSLAASEWTGTAGKVYSKMEVVAKSVELVSGAGSTSATGGAPAAPPPPQSQQSPQQKSTEKASTPDAQLSEDAAWEALFRNPADFYDNRSNKRNPRGPDFVHKQSRKALWLDSYRRPAWVMEKLNNNRDAPISPA
ncbi:hypothetical protein BSKO_04988 [Bryopsis sp. KO-2023]|nr:hypothetical protein BSKO_04988 [Bryopsis sp. KO-2023]